MEKIFSFAWRGKRGLENVEETGDPDDHLVDDEQGKLKSCCKIKNLIICKKYKGLQRKHKVDTTLQIHFFGKKGNKGKSFNS